MAIFLFRVNGGEVSGTSVDLNAYVGVPVLFSTITNPTLPDGADISVPKILDGTTVRNATAPEIANFAVALAADQNTIDKQIAQDFIDVDPTRRKAFKAVALTLIDEINILRALHSLPDRTLAQAVTTIKAKIANEDVT